MKEMSLNFANSDGRPWYREPWPWLLMLGPAVVVVAGVFTAWLAFRSNDGLVVDDYYKQGLSVNQTLERDQRAVAQGLRADIMRSGMQLRVMLGGNASLVLPERLSLKLMHPTRGGEDQTVLLVADGAGLYTGKLSKEISGRWTLALEDSSGQWRLYGHWQADAQESQRLVVGEDPAKFNRPLQGR